MKYEKITIPSHMAKISLSVINGVHWRSGAEGRRCQLLERQGEQENYSSKPFNEGFVSVEGCHAVWQLALNRRIIKAI